jgi:4a-hydroxytetrahydrobiopterin dehydratase
MAENQSTVAKTPRPKERTYADAEIAEKLKEIPGWYYEDGWIRRQYKTDGWPTTLMLVNTIGYLSEAAYHHPDLAVTWAKVWVKLQTHSAGGITDKDLELARKIEESVLWRPSGGALEGTPNKFVRGGDPR